MKILTKIFGTRNDKTIKSLQPIVAKINSLEPRFQAMTDEELRGCTADYRRRFEGGESLDLILPEAFATCREASQRALGQRHYDVQLLGGIVLHQGRIAEMKTGEGKTLTATLPAYLHGLSGQGAHVVTVNEYLATRDAEWMGKVFEFLGLTTGVICNGASPEERRDAYAADVTYGTNNEFGFDYLRDNMAAERERLVQRGHSFAIVDEVDSILIDEARTPLIISGPAETQTERYGVVNTAIAGVQKDSDYVVDEKSRNVSLTEDGVAKMEKRLRIHNLYEPEHVEWLHHIQQALKAHVLFKKDVDYVVRDNQVIIVDEFTGRLMAGRRYSDGLHGALEAKEHVPIQRETQTLATITFQNYFRLYQTLSGMTGTADTEAVEFKKIYNLDVVVMPTNRPLVREDLEDVIYRTAREKYEAIAAEIQKAQAKGQPVLVGTASVERSELLSRLLNQLKVPHEVLNAKQHAREAGIIATAGHKGRVTIATNMAGRGTDIGLGDGVRELGGLYVVATERNESRRIDNQLRGRSGRQGDPGKSQFFLSLEDDLMRIFASDRMSAIMSRLGMEEGEAIVAPMVTRAIERAQKRVEEQNFSSRKNVLEYDDVMSQQRQVVYTSRRKALYGEKSVDFMEDCLHRMFHTLVSHFSPENADTLGWDLQGVENEVKKELGISVSLKESLDEQNCGMDQILDALQDQVMTHYEKKCSALTNEQLAELEAFLFLQIVDSNWKDHLLSMDALKDSVSLRGYGQRDPLQEYKKEAFNLFTGMMHQIEEQTCLTLIKMPTPTLKSVEEAELNQRDIDMEELDYQHPTAELPQNSDDDNMVYHGSQVSNREKPRAQTIRRDHEKVGRNDPCPCGSGKKFKKCHGINTK
ncbi:MAG: preprotein translocase subunit SecA [Oligoflexales bacterium]